MATRVSFNQWLSLQKTGPYAELAAKWKTTRGRLTRTSVMDRAAWLGLTLGDGADAWDAYEAAVATPAPADDGAVLALDPSL